MTPDQWTKVNDLFHAVLERPAVERRAWLAAAAGTDPDVVREVEALVAAHEREPDFLESPAAMPTMPAVDTAPSIVGRRIGAYHVTRELARGGMGIVYLAHDTRLGRDVAIKALPREVPADGRRRERLRREARAAAALAHPNIAVVYALEEEGDELYLVSEYVRGSTLREELATIGPLPAARLIDTAIEITRAIGAAHAEGIVHRDLKPDNVMRAQTGAIKVLDFGLARAMASWADEDLTPTLTRSGTLLGTPAYMAPEQIRGGPVDARVDLFAVGVMFYELASGIHPFDGTAVGLTLHRILTEAPQPLAAHGVLVPPGFWAIVERCLEKEPAARYADASALLDDLLRVRETFGASPLGPSSPLAPVSGIELGTVEAEMPSRSSQWWWQFHQLAVSAFFAVLVVPTWQTWEWIPAGLFRTGLRVATLVMLVTGVSLRLHLWFLSRYDPIGLAEQRPRAAPWVAAADAGISLALLAGALGIIADHARLGAVFLGLSVCYAVVFLMIEPATTRAAFREQ